MKHKLMYTSPVIKKLNSIVKGTQDKRWGDKVDGGAGKKDRCRSTHPKCS